MCQTKPDGLPESRHPFDPLTGAEISSARDAVRTYSEEHLDVQSPRFAYITLVEPASLSDDGSVRKAEALIYLPPSTPHRLYVGFSSDEQEPLKAVVVSCDSLPGVQPVLTPADCALAEEIVKGDSDVQALLRTQYQLDACNLICDPWSVHISEDAVSGEDAVIPGASTLDDLNDMRLVQTFLYADPDCQGAVHNHYAHPLHLLPIVDLVSQRVVSIHGRKRVPPPKMPSERVNYHKETLPQNTYLVKSVDPHLLKPLDIIQNKGPSFEIEGRLVSWFKWKFRVGFNYREGVTLHEVSFDERPVLRRASLVEMAVPYADPRPPFPRKCAFDVGDYGLGNCANSLSLGCDCLGTIHYFDATLANENGHPYVIENAICLHEEDAGIFHKHMDYRSGLPFARRARKFVVSFVATVVNYEYLFYWNFHMDGSLSLEIRLSGELSTNLLSEGEEMPNAGTLVAPGVNAQLHQHMFCARLEPTVAGHLNSVSELNAVAATQGEGDPYGNAFKLEETLCETELVAIRDCKPGRVWRIYNATKANPISKTPRSYRLVPTSNPLLLTSPECNVSQRAGFARHSLWVSPLRSGERFPAGEFPTQCMEPNGVTEWTKKDESIVQRSLVVWHSFGILHLPRTEDFPIMPCEVTGFTLKPDCFSDGNPALDVDQVRSEESVCSSAEC